MENRELDFEELKQLAVVGGNDIDSGVSPSSVTPVTAVISAVTAISTLSITASMAFTCTPSCN